MKAILLVIAAAGLAATLPANAQQSAPADQPAPPGPSVPAMHHMPMASGSMQQQEMMSGDMMQNCQSMHQQMMSEMQKMRQDMAELRAEMRRLHR